MLSTGASCGTSSVGLRRRSVTPESFPIKRGGALSLQAWARLPRGWHGFYKAASKPLGTSNFVIFYSYITCSPLSSWKGIQPNGQEDALGGVWMRSPEAEHPGLVLSLLRTDGDGG